MPFLSVGLLRHLAGRAGEADVVIPDAAGDLQTLHAVYGKACLPAMERRLRAGRLKITGFFDEVRVLRVPEAVVAGFAAPELAFMNLNTPDDLARARALWVEQGADARAGRA
jgi:molybdopterin-guanine dinucleotide biosynthesis protein A